MRGRSSRQDRIYLKGNVYYTWGRDADGNKWAQSTHQRDPKAAALAAREIERQRAASVPGSRSKVTVDYALEQVLEFQRHAGRSDNTIRATEYHIAHLHGRFQGRLLADVTLADTTEYLRDRLEQPHTSRHTVKKELGTLTQAIRRCAKLGIYVPVVDPEHLIPDELGKAYEPRTRWLTRPEYEKLVQVLQPPALPARNQRIADESRVRAPAINRADYVVAWCNLGVRRSELFSILPEDYNPTRQELRVRGTKTERSDRLVPVNKAAAAVLDRRCALETPFPEWHDSNCTRDLARVCKLLEIRNVTPNDFRRTFCSWLCQAGVAERVCAELMGHGSTVMVRAVYGQLDMASMRRAVAQL